VAQEDWIVRYSWVLTEQHHLDPSLAEDIEAAVREQDHDAQVRAYVRFLEALEEAKGIE
jgi:hypothetical protein